MTKIISFFYKSFYKPIQFRMDPELVHDRHVELGSKLGKSKLMMKITSMMFSYKNESLVQTIDGVKFNNPVGLSGGFDKNADLFGTLKHVGFGFTEVGSITNLPYEGNPKPRLTRLPNSKGIVVYYGLKNIGVERIIEKMKGKHDPEFPVTISVAKTNNTCTSTTDGGIQDYTDCLTKTVASDIGDFYTINISCPNTFGGEPFTDAIRLEKLFESLSKVKRTKPLYVKMPINLEWQEFKPLLDVLVKYGVDGVIIGNLTKVRDPQLIKDKLSDDVKGGISGKPTWELSNVLISMTYLEYKDKLTIVGVGGIFSAEDAYEKIKRGSSLVQLITGMIYEGPQLIGDINRGLVRLMKADGYSNISEAVGAAHRE